MLDLIRKGLSILVLCGVPQVCFSEQIETYRDIIPYPYHAAPYYSYPYTQGFGYIYSDPIVNAEYHNTNNNQSIVVYPDGPYYYGNHYKYGSTVCFLKAHRLFCYDYQGAND